MRPGALDPGLTRVLRGLTPPLDAGALAVQRLGAGVQANLFLVRARDRSPVWQAHTELVVKLYKATDAAIDAVVRDEFESLSQLNARIDGCLINGWRIRTPIPLLRSASPPGLVMTLVPGRSLNAHLRAGGPLSQGDIDRLAGAIGTALWRYWNDESRIYGDIDFNNILCDPADRILSFVDPGMPETSYLCDSVGRRWYPASRDLAYLIFDVAASERAWLGRPVARRRQRLLLERVLHACLDPIDSAPAREALLDEVDACAHVHVRRINASWSLPGIWRALLRRIAARTIDRTIDWLRREPIASVDLLQVGNAPATSAGDCHA